MAWSVATRDASGVAWNVEQRELSGGFEAADMMMSRINRGDAVWTGGAILSATLDLRTDEVLEFPDGRFRVARELSGRRFLLIGEKAGLEREKTEEELVRDIGAERVIRYSAIDSRKKSPRGTIENEVDEVDPLAPSEQVMRARTFQYYVRAWDKDHSAGLGDVGLGRFIGRVRPHARRDGLHHEIKPARLRFAIKECGEPDDRPLRAFMSQKGKKKSSRLPLEIEDALSQTVDFYWGLRTRNYTDAFAFFRGLLRQINDERAGMGEPEIPPPERMETVRTRINKAANYSRWATKFTKKEADWKFNGVGDHLSAEEPGELVIMDHTVMDHWTLLDTDTRIPLGRLTLTVAIDVATRSILGYLISAEPPSLFSVLTVLKMVNKPKHYVKERYPNIVGVWDAWCHPRTLLVDNDMAFRSGDLEAAMKDIGTEIKFSPIATPQYKSIGERFFHTLNRMLFHKLPNGVPHNPKLMKQAGLDPSKDRCIDIKKLDELMHQLIITVYHKKRHEGLGGVPERIWNEKILRYRRRFINDPNKINALLGRLHIATLSRTGIRFNNQVFHHKDITSRLLRELLAHERKSAQGDAFTAARIKVKIKWDPMDCSSISVYHHGADPKVYVTMPNRDRKYTSGGLSYWLADKIRRHAIAEDKAFFDDESRWKARNDLLKAWEALIPERPRKEIKDALRAAAQENYHLLDNGDIIELEAEATVEGYSDPEGIEIDPNAHEGGDPLVRPHRDPVGHAKNLKNGKPSKPKSSKTSADPEVSARRKSTPKAQKFTDDAQKFADDTDAEDTDFGSILPWAAKYKSGK